MTNEEFVSYMINSIHIVEETLKKNLPIAHERAKKVTKTPESYDKFMDINCYAPYHAHIAGILNMIRDKDPKLAKLLIKHHDHDT